MKKLFLAFGIILFPLVSQAQINRENVTRIVKTLSSDDMKGRQALSPQIWKAAEFIADEFSEIGLQTLEGEDDYLQRFNIYSVSLKNARVNVGGSDIPSGKYFAMVNGEDVNWSENDNITVKHIKRLMTCGPDCSSLIRFGKILLFLLTHPTPPCSNVLNLIFRDQAAVLPAKQVSTKYLS